MKNGNIIVKCCFSVFLLNLFVLSSAFSFSIPHCTQITNIISISLRHVLMGRGLAKQNAKVNFLVTHTIINVAQHFGCDTREYLQET